MSYSIKNTKEFSSPLESLSVNKQQGGVSCLPRLACIKSRCEASPLLPKNALKRVNLKRLLYIMCSRAFLRK